MAKLSFQIKSTFSSNTETNISDSVPEAAKREPRTPRDYFVGLRDKRFLSLRRSQSQKDLNITTSKPNSPFSFSARMRKNVSPKTPQVNSLFLSNTPSRSENSRHHRQYAVSLSHLPRMRTATILDEQSVSLEPESPSEMTRLRRLNSRKSKSPRVPPVIVTAPSGDTPGLQDLREPPVKDEIIAQFRPIPPMDLKTPPSYRSRENTEDNGKQSIGPVSKNKKDSSFQEPLVRRNEMSGLHRVMGILQGAVRTLDGDPAISRTTFFRFLAPLVAFITVLILGVLIPRHFSYIKGIMGRCTGLFLPVLAMGVIACSLVLLEGCLKVACRLCQSFCEMDLDVLFRTNEIVDANGGRVGGADLVTGIFATG